MSSVKVSRRSFIEICSSVGVDLLAAATAMSACHRMTSLNSPFLAGEWVGQIQVGKEITFVRARFRTTSSAIEGSLDIPLEGISRLALSEVQVSSNQVQFTVLRGPRRSNFIGEHREAVLSAVL